MPRDLKADLTTCRSAISGRHYLEVARKGWPEATERAIKAEEDVRDLVKELDIERLQIVNVRNYYETELAKMQGVVVAAGYAVKCWDQGFGTPQAMPELKKALVALEGGPPCPK